MKKTSTHCTISYRFISASGLIGLLILIANTGLAQLVIRSGTNISFNQTPDIIIQMVGDLNTNGATDFANAKLQLNLAGAAQSVSGNLFVTTLRLTTGGNKTINNTLTVSEAIEFTAGILTPGNSGKILFTGNGSSITGGNITSFVNGSFYQTGGGYRLFPIGYTDEGVVYAPAIFENSGVGAGDEMSVEVIGDDPSLTFDNTRLNAVDNSRYWEITTPDISAVNSRVSLGIEGIVQTSDGSFAVVEAESVGVEATSLGFSFLDASLVTSRGEVTKSILAVGVVPEIIVLVHDLITPFLLDGANDKLTIDQIDQFDFNTVTLLDRWGGLVKRWENFTNEVDYDFSRLSPGNYIVVVEYGNLAEGSVVGKVSQMVTVLKTN